MKKEKMSVSKLLGYGLGEVGSQLIWYMVSSYLMLFYTDILTLSAGAIAMIMLVARIWDAVNDPMMGAIADRTRTKWGRFRPYIIFGTPVLALFNLLTFTVFPVHGVVKVALALICYIGAGMAYTAVSTAYASLVNVIAKKSQEKQDLSAARTVGSSVAQLVLAIAAMPLILKLGHSEVATGQGYFRTVLLFSLVAIPCLWLIAFLCKETYGNELHQNHEKKSLKESLINIFRNKQIVLAMLVCFMVTTAIMGRITLLSYYVIYVMGSYTLVGAVMGVMCIGAIVFSMLIPIFTRIMGKRNWLICICSIMSIGMIGTYFADPTNVPVILVLSFMIGVGNSGQGVIFGMFSDCIDYSDYKYGVREEGLSFSFITFAVKLAGALVGAVGVVLLAKFGYVAGVEQTEAAKAGINMVVNIIPAICTIIGLIPLFFYKLSNKKMAEIAQELEKRKIEKE